MVVPNLFLWAIFCFSVAFSLKGLHDFSKLFESLESFKEKEKILINCGQNKANYLNTLETYSYLMKNNADKVQEISKIKEKILEKFFDPDCQTICFSSFCFKGSAHLQNIGEQPIFWPNWVLSVLTVED